METILAHAGPRARAVRMAEARDFRTEFQDFRKEVNGRFDGVTREIGDLRERMAKLEGTLEGFVAGRRDRDAAA